MKIILDNSMYNNCLSIERTREMIYEIAINIIQFRDRKMLLDNGWYTKLEGIYLFNHYNRI